MANYERRPRRRKKQRGGLIALVVLLVVLLAVLVAVTLFSKPKINLHSELTMEAGGELPKAQSFLAEEGEYILSYADASAVKTNAPGTYKVELACDGKKYTSAIRVVDTTAPTGKVQDLTAFAPDIPVAEDFVTETHDITEVTVSFLNEPVKTQSGQQNLTIVLTDTSGNTTELSAVLTLFIDETAPVIEGVADKIIYQGDTVAYMSGVTVTDDYDSEPQLNVDRSTVDLNTPGEYQVVYTATDDSGNQSSVTMKLTVLVKKENYVSYEVIYEEVDAILAQIIEEDMSTKEQVWAIYVWIRSNCKYISHSDKDDWMQAAHLMMTEREGDCFNYYSLCKLMLDRLGIPNLDVRKVKIKETSNDHYWSLVSIDGGENYYHVDTTPRKDPVTLCLVTDAFMDDYSASHGNCFNRDMSLYPPTPEVGP